MTLPVWSSSTTAEPKEPKPKGHGRNAASAYRQAQHVFHALALGVIGALSEVCRLAKVHRYREKSIIRIIGRPMFGAEVHHFEQARCRGCGNIVDGAGRPRELRDRPPFGSTAGTA